MMLSVRTNKYYVLVSARMSAVIANVVVGQPVDCSIFWLQ